jgi:hypothetical protein
MIVCCFVHEKWLSLSKNFDLLKCSVQNVGPFKMSSSLTSTFSLIDHHIRQLSYI